MKPQIPKSIDQYIASAPKEVQGKLREIRKAIHEAAPEAEEAISYRMPAFRQNGVLVYFAAFKDHIGFFPTSSGVAAFKDRLADYKTSKGTVQLPLDQPLPIELIKEIVKFRVEENSTNKKSLNL
jgi:uncharacterized protein YdhG (YjbR/CyaY superfamily)